VSEAAAAAAAAATRHKPLARDGGNTRHGDGETRGDGFGVDPARLFG